MRVLIASLIAFTLGSTTAAIAQAQGQAPDPPPCHQTAPGKYVCTIKAPANTRHLNARFDWPGTEQRHAKHFTVDWFPTRPGLRETAR